MIGIRWRIATSCARRSFRIVSGHEEPAFTGASLETMTTSRPSTTPMPVMTPAPGPVTLSSAIADRPVDVFLTLALELALLAASLGVAWGVLHTLRERGSAFKSIRRVLELPEARARLADRKAAAEAIDQKILALVMCTAVMAVLMMVLCRSSSRAQVFFAVGISAYVAVPLRTLSSWPRA